MFVMYIFLETKSFFLPYNCLKNCGKYMHNEELCVWSTWKISQAGRECKWLSVHAFMETTLSSYVFSWFCLIFCSSGIGSVVLVFSPLILFPLCLMLFFSILIQDRVKWQQYYRPILLLAKLLESNPLCHTLLPHSWGTSLIKQAKGWRSRRIGTNRRTGQ